MDVGKQKATYTPNRYLKTWLLNIGARTPQPGGTLFREEGPADLGAPEPSKSPPTFDAYGIRCAPWNSSKINVKYYFKIVTKK